VTPADPSAEPSAAVCLDVGSTWTKAVLIRSDGALAGFAEHPTTVTDVLAGVDAAVRAVVAAAPNAPDPQLLACSSAGGGLRLAVVGTDRLTAEEAGHRVARSAGSRVVHVHAGPLDPGDVRVLRGSRPGVVLLIGGADGDDPAPLLHNAARLARARVRFPIVLAGNDAARQDALALLAATGRTVVACANVAPRLGELRPGPARAAVAELYAQHVLGGRGPAAAPRFRRLVRVGTPDAVSSGAALLATMLGVRVLVVDIGCATTDVHLAVPESPAAQRSPTSAGSDPGSCLTAEGDLGMRSSAAGVLVEGQAEGVVDPVEADLLGPTVERMASEVGYVPRDAGSAAEDRRIAALAAVLAVRRHRVAHEASGRILDDIGLLVLTGGVFRRPDANGLAAVVATVRNDLVLAPLLAKARVAVDADFAVTPAGLLAAAGRTDAARSLLHDHLLG
jgi:ADP-dependent NAD(P)H-hydrate dehydratase / NAD(P)H-hydrate epimerase